MKKFLRILFSVLFVVCPLVIRAAESEKIDLSKYNTLNYTQTLEDEEIAREFDNYEETDSQATIYMFRGKGCGFCRAFLNFMNSITTEYGDYFKIVSFESWYDANNNELLNTISEFMGEKATGVPYIIIGDQVFAGYASSYDDSIKAAITELYNSGEKYDVFEEYNKAIDAANKEKNAGFNKVIIWNFVFILIATCVIVLYIKNQNNKIMARIEEMNSRTETKAQKEENAPINKQTTKKVVKNINAKKK